MAKPGADRSKIHSTIYYSEVSYLLLEQMAQEMGLNKTAVVEYAIRELARARKMKIPPPKVAAGNGIKEGAASK